LNPLIKNIKQITVSLPQAAYTAPKVKKTNQASVVKKSNINIDRVFKLKGGI